MDDLPDVLLEKLDSARRYDRYILSLCPFHSESRPSFLVYPDKYRCLSCGVYGNTSDLVEKLDTIHFVPKPEAHYGFNPFTKWTKNHTLFEILKIANGNLPVHYLKTRGIDLSVQQNLRLGYLDDWITFPIMNRDNKVIGAVARAGEDNVSKSKYVLPYKQNPDLLYVPSWKRCNAKDTIYVTFGIVDAITLYASGFASMSTTTGKRINPSAFDNVRKSIIIVPDEGETSEALKLAAKLGWRGKVLQLDYPSGCKDLNDILWKANKSLDEIKEIISEQI